MEGHSCFAGTELLYEVGSDAKKPPASPKKHTGEERGSTFACQESLRSYWVCSCCHHGERAAGWGDPQQGFQGLRLAEANYGMLNKMPGDR